MLNFISKNFYKILTFILLVVVVFFSGKYFVLIKKYEQTPVEVWLLNGASKDMSIKNTLLVISNNYEKQFITGGSLYILNDEIKESAKEVKVFICYESDETCFFNRSVSSTEGNVWTNNNPISIGSRSTTAFKDGFIKDKANKLFKNRDDFENKLFSMFIKVEVIDSKNVTKNYILKIVPNPKFNKRSTNYEIPYNKNK